MNWINGFKVEDLVCIIGWISLINQKNASHLSGNLRNQLADDDARQSKRMYEFIIIIYQLH